MRLQVFLSHNGVCSRRKAMEIIQGGQVKVNGEVQKEPSTKVDPVRDRVEVNGRPIAEKNYTYILLNKPTGYVTTTTDRFQEKMVLDLLPEELRHLKPAGRLDKDTEGVLLLTNDGDVAYQLTHPKFNIDKVYQVRIAGTLNAQEKSRLERGVVVEGQKTYPAKIKDMKPVPGGTEFLMIIHEGRKRQIRMMLREVGHHVNYLNRLAQGPLTLGTLKPGQWRELNGEEIKMIKSPAKQKIKLTP